MTRLSNFYQYLKENVNYQPFYHGSPYLFDKFDMSKVGTGDGLSKYGYGLYFSDNISAASYYAKELSIGKFRNSGFNLYEVRLRQASKYLLWDDYIPDNIFQHICDKLEDLGMLSDVDTIKNDTSEENGYSMWSVHSFYEYLEVILLSKKEATNFLYECGVYGVSQEDVNHGGTIYVAYSDSDVNIIQVEKIK